MLIRELALRSYAAAYMVSAMGALAVTLNSVDPLVSGDSAEPSPIFVLAWVALYGLTFLCAPFVRWRFNKGDLLVLSVAGYLLLGAVWSHLPAATLRYAASFGMNVIAALVITRIVDRAAFPRFFTFLLLAVAALSIALQIVGYENVTWLDPHSRDTVFGTAPLKGLFFHKIPAGIYAALGLWLSIILFRGWLRFLAAATFLVFDGLTGSSIGLALVIIVPLLISMAYVSRQGRFSTPVFFALFGMVLSLGAGFFYTAGPAVLELLDRDPTLTGRTLLWSWGLDTALERPVFGWGFFGYFGSDEASAVARQILVFRNYDVPHFHNSYIQMLVEMGFLPAFLLFMTFAVVLGRWLRTYVRSGTRDSLAFYTIVSTILFVAIFSLVFLRYNDISTLLLLICICYAYRPQRSNYRSQALSDRHQPSPDLSVTSTL